MVVVSKVEFSRWAGSRISKVSKELERPQWVEVRSKEPISNAENDEGEDEDMNAEGGARVSVPNGKFSGDISSVFITTLFLLSGEE